MAHIVNGIDELVQQVQATRLPAPAARRRIRLEAGVTLRQAAAALGVDPMTIVRWEKDTATPRAGHAVAYRRLLDGLERVTP